MSQWETGPIVERLEVVTAYSTGKGTMAALCAERGWNPKTGFKWLKRFNEGGLEALRDLPRVAHRNPNAISEESADAIVVLKLLHPNWGPKKLVVLMDDYFPDLERPGVTAAASVLERNGLVERCPQRRRAIRRATHLEAATVPNDIWAADHKGHFRLGDGSHCYPLTVTDSFSRFILACTAVGGIHGRSAKETFEELFQEYGLPRRIRTDNGSPFGANRGLALSKLSLWWMRLGIVHERIRAGRPQQNGRHERMHGTLNEVVDSPERSSRAQQLAFDEFVDEYNQRRPHEALGMRAPAELYQPSARQLPQQVPPLQYPAHYARRGVSSNGRLSIGGRSIFITKVLEGEEVGLEELPDECLRVWAGAFPLGVIELRKKCFQPYDEEEQRAVG